MKVNGPEPHTLAGAYAMDALDGDDRTAFERHLARCAECTREVAGLREATARLAVAASVQPPPALKDLVKAATSAVRQLPPVTGGATGGGRGAVPAGRRTGQARRAASPLHPRSWLPRVALPRVALPRVVLALAGAAVLVAGIFWVTGRPGQSATPPVPAGQSIAEVLTAPDATTLTARVTTGGHATVVMSVRDRMLVFTAAGLRTLPASQCYELWLLEPGRDLPAGVLGMVSHGMAGPLVAAGLHSGDRLGLTVEPASGSRQPTGPMLMVLAL